MGIVRSLAKHKQAVVAFAATACVSAVMTGASLTAQVDGTAPAPAPAPAPATEPSPAPAAPAPAPAPEPAPAPAPAPAPDPVPSPEPSPSPAPTPAPAPAPAPSPTPSPTPSVEPGHDAPADRAPATGSSPLQSAQPSHEPSGQGLTLEVVQQALVANKGNPVCFLGTAWFGNLNALLCKMKGGVFITPSGFQYAAQQSQRAPQQVVVPPSGGMVQKQPQQSQQAASAPAGVSQPAPAAAKEITDVSQCPPGDKACVERATYGARLDSITSSFEAEHQGEKDVQMCPGPGGWRQVAKGESCDLAEARQFASEELGGLTQEDIVPEEGIDFGSFDEDDSFGGESFSGEDFGEDESFGGGEHFDGGSFGEDSGFGHEGFGAPGGFGRQQQGFGHGMGPQQGPFAPQGFGPQGGSFGQQGQGPQGGGDLGQMIQRAMEVIPDGSARAELYALLMKYVKGEVDRGAAQQKVVAVLEGYMASQSRGSSGGFGGGPGMGPGGPGMMGQGGGFGRPPEMLGMIKQKVGVMIALARKALGMMVEGGIKIDAKAVLAALDEAEASLAKGDFEKVMKLMQTDVRVPMEKGMYQNPALAMKIGAMFEQTMREQGIEDMGPPPDMSGEGFHGGPPQGFGQNGPSQGSYGGFDHGSGPFEQYQQYEQHGQ